MRHGTARHQMTIDQMELPLESRGEAPRAERRGEAEPTARGPERSGDDDLMTAIVERSNLARALKRVRRNQGSPGIDGMTVEELGPYLRDHWPGIREALLAGTYQPRAVRHHEIEKSGGGMRTLGIPTVLDRFIQQAIFRSCNRDSIPPSRSSATAFGRAAGRMMRCVRRNGTCSRAGAGWWMWIWKSSVIASTTMCSWAS